MTAGAAESPWHAVAREKLVRIFGPLRGEQLLRDVLQELGLETIASVNDLAAVGDRLSAMGGFVGSLGVVLKTHASLRGGRTVPA